MRFIFKDRFSYYGLTCIVFFVQLLQSGSIFLFLLGIIGIILASYSEVVITKTKWYNKTQSKG